LGIVQGMGLVMRSLEVKVRSVLAALLSNKHEREFVILGKD
jgi:hypothetical protein